MTHLALKEKLNEKARPEQKKVFLLSILLGGLGAFGPLSIDMYLPGLPQLAADFSTSASLAQFSLTACLLGIALGQMVVGPISDVRGRRVPLLAGLAAYVAASLLCIAAPTIATFVGLRFVQGLAGAAGIVIARAVARDLYEGVELTRFTALLMLVNGVAPIIAPVWGGMIMQFASWRMIFLVLAVLGAAMAAAVALGLKETLPQERRLGGGLRGMLQTFGALLTHRSFIGYALTQGFVMAGMFAYIAGSPFVLQNIYGVSPQQFSLYFGLNAFGIIVAGQTTGRLAIRLGERRLLLGGLAMAGGGAAALLAVTLSGGGLLPLLASLFFVVSSVGVVGASSFTLAMQDQAQAAGSGSALIGLLSFVIGGLMAPLVGLGGGQTAVPLAIVIALAETAAVLSYFILVRSPKA